MFLHEYEANKPLLRTKELLTQLTAQTPPVSRLLLLKFLHQFTPLWWIAAPNLLCEPRRWTEKLEVVPIGVGVTQSFGAV